MGDPRAAIVLVTDYGTADSYAGSLVGALWSADPEVRWATGTHGVPPGDVLAGAYHVKALARSFPVGTVICAVVDPGVGTDRRAIAIEADGIRLVAPDNGLCSWLWEEADVRRCVAVPVPPDASPTFAGRDHFAPLAARLAAGAGLEECGPRIEDPVILPAAFPRRVRSALYARVCVVDRFGNAITTARMADLAGARAVAATWNGGGTHRMARTYADIGGGLALVAGSAGHLEVAARGVPAVSRGGPAAGESVRITLGPG
jgi:S-adenosylmethionine hydrolase